MVDFERAAKIASSRFAVLRGKRRGARAGADLLHARPSHRQHGYTEIIPPYLVNSASLFGTGQLPKFADDLFHVEDFDLYLVPTAEVPLTNLHRDETLDEAGAPRSLLCLHSVLPRRSGFARARCSRSDPAAPVPQGGAGSLRSARGIVGSSRGAHRARRGGTSRARASLPRRLPWRAAISDFRPPRPTTSRSGCRPSTATGKSHPAPTSPTFRPAAPTSASGRSEGGKPRHLHTLNGSGLAAGRTMVAVLENYQQADGSVVVPEVLRPYMGGLEVD